LKKDPKANHWRLPINEISTHALTLKDLNPFPYLFTAKEKKMTEKMVVVCNGEDAKSIMPTLIFASSGLALDYEVHVFFCPAGTKWTLKDELEKLGSPKGLPNPVKLFNDILELGGRVVLCELALENKGVDPNDLRDSRIIIEKAPPFLMAAEGATMTFTF
jgi:predicted peroxiredoxin